MNIATAPRYRWQLLNAGPIWLDGGSMFGIIPKAIWNRTVPCDELGRIELAHNCLLLEGPQRVLIETGSGNKFDGKNRRIFGLSNRSIIDAVEETGVHCEDIEHVIVTHLHFDHAGGLTRLSRTAEIGRPENLWAGGVARPTFPNATIHVQRREWDDALANRSTMTRTYLRDHLDPIRHQLSLIDSPDPFPPGYLPDREELPPTPLTARETEILPGIFVFNVPGHTWGQQAVRFRDDTGQTVVFTPDIMPTASHVGPAYNMAYDVEPYISTVTRHWFLDEAATNDWLLVLDHEPRDPLQKVRSDTKGWYELLSPRGMGVSPMSAAKQQS